MKELGILRQLNHKNVTNLQALLEDKSREKIYAILDMCEGGECVIWSEREFIFSPSPKLEFVKSSGIPEKELQSLFGQLINGLEYCKD